MDDFLDDELPPAHRELTLSTPLLLLLFLALAVVCGVFFGLGYMAHTSRQARNGPEQPAAEAVAAHSTFSSFKPPAGSPTTGPSRPPVAAAVPVAANGASPPSHTATVAPGALPAKPVGPAKAPVTSVPPASAGPPNAAPAGNFVVQLAAISPMHAEDADMLVSALRSKGYAVAVRKEADGLLHVQAGPYANRKDADAMRQKLEADGYKPFIK